MISIRVLFLGPARDYAGTSEIELDVPDASTIGDLKDILAERYPDIGRAIRAIRFAVNESFAQDDQKLEPGDEVALIPPVSGGAGDAGVWVELVDGPIPADKVRTFATGDKALGGIVTFEGATRAEEDDDHGALERLDYEAYDTMARRQLELLARRAVERYSAGRVAIVHRLGAVLPGEASVIIAVACAHRAEAFKACRYLIDTLKQDVPIWKKDVFADGFVRWVQPGGAQGEQAGPID